MTRGNWEWRSHAPDWVPFPLRINAEGDTRPGFLCMHQLENGKGMCESNTFDQTDNTEHACMVKIRGRWKYSRPCYDKYHRCPGWAGGGWKYGENHMCDNGRINVDYEDRWWKWKTHRCRVCDVVVLPYMVRYTSPRQWWYSVDRMFRR